MSRRLNMIGFSFKQMQELCGSQDEEVLIQIRDRVAKELNHVKADDRSKIVRVIEQAIASGIPFPELQKENWIHSIAAKIIGFHNQELLLTDASDYHASALEEGLWGTYSKLAKPDVVAFLRVLVNGLPVFGKEPTADGSSYAVVSLDRLRIFQPGIRELAEKIAYCVKQNPKADEEELAGSEFAFEFCAWIDRIVAAERDLFFMLG